jgi:glycosyltransferase involved in cell wall biosynthesis
VTVLHLVKTGVGADWARRQMREMVRLGLRVHVAMPNGPLEERYRAAGVSVHVEEFDFPASAPWRLRGRLERLAALVRRIRPDIIHSHFVGTTLTMRMAMGKRHDTPRVFQVPGPLHLEHRLFRSLELASAGPTDYWIGSCAWTCREYQRAGIPTNRIFLSYYGVDLDSDPSRGEADTKWLEDVPRGSKLVGLVAFMYPPKFYLGQTRGLKGHEDLIDALQICRRTQPDVVGVFVGGAWNNALWYGDRVRSHGKRTGGARNLFLGTRHDVRQLYRSFDVAVCPSHSENVGAAVESLLCGVPTIATDVGGLPDLVKHGQTGWLVPARNPLALSTAITEALQDQPRARQLARNGQKLSENMFDVRKTAAQVVDIYQQILSGTSVGCCQPDAEQAAESVA